jgi:YHS domain-containing protein
LKLVRLREDRETMTPEVDPICGMSVDPRKAPAQGTYGGKVVYFCSATCKRKYEAKFPPS